jgi:hypothetical protein
MLRVLGFIFAAMLIVNLIGLMPARSPRTRASCCLRSVVSASPE